jgi:hypothetical protein
MEAKTNKKPNGYIYSEQEKTLLNTIITCNNTTAENSYKIGESCNNFVNLNGGIKHGDKTLEKILQYPNMTCCRDHLVDCWNYYKFVNNEAYQSKSLDKLKNEKPSALYQIFRIANCKLKEGEKNALVNKVVEEADKEDQTVRHVEAVVTAILKDKGQMRKSRTPKQENICPITKQNIQQIVGSIKQVVSSEEQLKWFMGSQKNRQEVMGLLEVLLGLVEIMPDYNKDKTTSSQIVSNQIKKFAKRLNIVAEKIN